MGKEILTLQFGQKANYLATHFWNAQEANFVYGDSTEELIIDNDVHFRAGVGQGGVETYTPRTLIYDLKGGFGSLRKYNELYEALDSKGTSTWDGTVQTYSQPLVPVNPYQAALDTGDEEDVLTTAKVRWWSDFNRVYYHPRSAIQLNQYSLQSSFDSFTQGSELFHEVHKDDDLLDRDVRTFAEECDSLQGFQILLESDSAWGGFATEYLEMIRGEYPKAPIWTWGIESGLETPTRKFSFAQTIASFHENTSLYIPLVQPSDIPSSISIDRSSYWHISALFSLLYDTITVSTRTSTTHPYSMDMYEFESRVNVHGQRKFANSEAAVLFDHPHIGDIMAFGWKKIPTRERPLLASVFRGTISQDIDDLTKNLTHGSVVTERILHPQNFPLISSFPKIFESDIRSVAAFGAFSSDPTTVWTRLKEVGDDARKLASLEEREELVHSIGEIASFYDEQDDLDSDID